MSNKKQKLAYIKLNLQKVNSELPGLTGSITWGELKYKFDPKKMELEIMHDKNTYKFKVKDGKSIGLKRIGNFVIEPCWSNHLGILINKLLDNKLPLSNF